jgi:hydroxymethylpyrimidine/phosphomethylpyrimidine kinase
MKPTVLIIAGTDPSGGAGIVRDVATVTALGLKACVAVTAVTVQTNRAVRHVEAMPATLIAAQMEATLEAGNVGALKIGMVPSVEAILAVAAVLARHPHLPVVVDPVLSATSGASLSAEGGSAALRDHLFPLATLITPNLPELARLTGRTEAQTVSGALDQAATLLAGGTRAVLVKGGHADDEADAIDLLFTPDADLVAFRLPRLTGTMRGTGCMLSSALAAGLAEGCDLASAIDRAKKLVHRAIAAAQ